VLEAARTRWQLPDLPVFAGLLACGVVAIESSRSLREVRGLSRDLQTVWYLPIAVVLPPAYALAAPFLLSAYRFWRAPRGFIYRRVFSNATISLAYGTASYLFHHAAARLAAAGPGKASHAVIWAGVVAACGATGWLINHGLLVIAIRIHDPQTRVRDHLATRQTVTSDVVELSLGVVVSFLAAVSWYLVALAVLPVVMYRRSIMIAQIQARTRTDAPTGLLNEAAWRREAELEITRAQRHRVSLAVAIASVDHLVDYGGVSGGEMSDQVLRHSGLILQDLLPAHYLAGRLGSEEFAILLPQTGGDEAQEVSELLRDHIAAETIAIESGAHAGFVLRPTVSIGIASLSESCRTLADLAAGARAALLQARSIGWSKVYQWNDDSSGR
jgi:diguanylate cyclase (GGDEF)-like protein